MDTDLTEDDLRTIYKEIEKAISKVRTDSRMKEIKYQYFLTDADMQTFDKLYYIITGDIRKELERFFDKQIEGIWDKLSEEDAEKRKRPRKTAAKAVPKKEIKETTQVGSLTFA